MSVASGDGVILSVYATIRLKDKEYIFIIMRFLCVMVVFFSINGLKFWSHKKL